MDRYGLTWMDRIFKMSSIRVEAVGSGVVLIPYLDIHGKDVVSIISEIESRLGPVMCYVPDPNDPFRLGVRLNCSHKGCIGEVVLVYRVCPECSRDFNKAAEKGHLECLRYEFEHGGSINEETCIWAAQNGHLACLRYLYEHGCSWDEWTINWATENGHLDCLQYALDHECPVDDNICLVAALYGQLDCLRELHQRGFSWNHETCNAAAENGHLACLQYAHEHGCPWNEEAFEHAVEHNYLPCILYLIAQKCPGYEKYETIFVKTE